MHPWTRPPAHATFKAESESLLDALRLDVSKNGGRAHSDHFEKRALWTYSWQPPGQPRGLHRRAMTGSEWFAKCVWCEQLREPKRELDVEHYRPKVWATEWEGAPPVVSEEPPKEVKARGGYWWLAFSWDNLALSCKTCNQGWKRNLFPVRTPRTRDLQEGDERGDAPLLINPSDPFRVASHFRWTPEGFVEPVSDEGRATIITCGLNRRVLRERRGQVAENAIRRCCALITAVRRRDRGDAQRAQRELAGLGSVTSEFTGMVRWLAERHVGRPWGALGLPP